MTTAQKTAKEKFKKAIEYRKKTGVSLKEAFAHIYGRKVGAVKKRLGALPIGFKGSIYDIPFKIVNQYDIYNDVSAIMEDTNNGNRIVAFDGKGSAKDKAEAIVSYISKITNVLSYKDDKELYRRMLKFATNMQKEVKDFNFGKKKTIKKEPLKIVAPKNIVTTKKRLPSVIKSINKTIDKVYKKNKAKKSALKKPVAKKVARQTRSPRKVKATYKVNYQTGESNRTDRGKNQDAKRKALPPGKRISTGKHYPYKKGNTYYETRANRTDFSRSAMTGVNDIKKESIKKYQEILKEISVREFIIQKRKEYKNTLVKLYGLKSYASDLNKNKAYIKELKIHARELKKHI